MQGGEGHLSRLVVHGSTNKNVFYDQFCEVLPASAFILCNKTSFMFRRGNNLYIQLLWQLSASICKFSSFKLAFLPQG